MSLFLFATPTANPNPIPPDITAIARDVAVDRFSLSAVYAQEAWQEALAFIANLGNADFSTPDALTPEMEDVPPPDIGDRPLVNRPADFVSMLEKAEFPVLAALIAELGLTEIELERVTIPELVTTPYSILLPTPPDTTLPEIPEDVPEVRDPVLPSLANLEIPEPPSLTEILVEDPPGVSIPQWEATKPDWDLTPPEPAFLFAEETRDSDLKDALNTKLYHDIVLGGTGLGEEIEAAIFANHLERTRVQNEEMFREAESFWAARNHELPPGALAGKLIEISMEIRRNNVLASNDIMIKSADLAQQNTQFAITSGMVMEKQLNDYASQVAQRAFEVAKFTVQWAIELYSAKVAAFGHLMEAYRIEAQVYSERIRAEVLVLEAHKLKLEAARLRGELNEQAVRIYAERIRAVGLLIDLYKAEMEGARLQLDVDRAKIEGFRSRLEAVTTQIQAKTATYDLYQAQIAGEKLKVDLHLSEVSAFRERMGGAKIEADINIAEARALIESNRDKIEVLKAAIEKYRTESQVNISVEESRVKGYEGQVTAYTADTQALRTYLEGLVDTYKAKISESKGQLDAQITNADNYLRVLTMLKDIQIRSLDQGAGVISQLAASALSSVSASAQLGYSEQLSHGYSGTEALSKTISQTMPTWGWSY